MTKEKLFEFAAERGWDKVLELAHNIHTLPEIAAKLNKEQSHLEIELRAMCAMGLLQLVSQIPERYRYVPTVLGVKFMQEQNQKEGRTFSCQLCGTTTGRPHVCPEFYPEMRE
ncbi:MAG: hypothetical protein A3I26_03580 [Candidatus Yanofskybacteria bacterium RIFCSPLOWO2_02_FULL_43_10]|uniref:Uncharacterized protein n=1 Tax=Candidatus Yanofskybacteria bacterium RIFCSPLOWO2_12_FULL_43_11b TaxID=1802710 RepID=A0A1F8H869_9BACT|nr:MAG: hypothetical protein A2742_01375 [Candidatus Yanofskybacteria bacterium RIFCSPHIGHO2_01_FULL_43_32]OGN11988.1 MAG: hypothetical protein A3C69_02905 [Candidatus Yanofskybacteria bacterium RIFCSPHIGHO2_02_FULL_43_12]OGN17815.1 MAG: hypothetical protein A3E34_01110 [Candidatus Yanofskybacteria bacterium RIFCSPHIGHO2_12_FULL_43_11]OGN24773.1 MAG: hypothetical protein A2923_03065 [Candidatus Yanofskybacteria bacterium RIFCSPLOWO2_01_FULL_43_46]OGN30299.1 MAG: hypothetical protein A3I26_03580